MSEIERLRAAVEYWRSRYESETSAEVARLMHLNENAVTRIAFLERALEQAQNFCFMRGDGYVKYRGVDQYEETVPDLADWLRGKENPA